MKDKKLHISFLSLVFGGSLLLNAVAMVPPHSGVQMGVDPTDGIHMAGKYFSMINNNQVTGTVDPRDILEGEKAIKNMKSERAFGLNWIQRGPDNIGGRTKSIIVDNKDATGKTLFAGSVAGGVWKSLTDGLTWNELDGSGININVSCMVQAANGDIYAGTGEDYTKGWGVPALIGRGIFKSSDGNTFSLLQTTVPSGIEWNFINELAIEKSSSRIYAATNTGLKYSDNGGADWTYARSASGADLSGDASDVKVASDAAVVVSLNNQCWISQNGDANNFLLFSNDAVTGLLPSTGIGRFEFAFAPSDPNVLYALAAYDGTRFGSKAGALENVYKSTDKGSSWTVIGPGGSPNFDLFGPANHGLYGNTIEVFPNDPNRILAGGFYIWEGKKVLETGYYQWDMRGGGQDVHAFVFGPANSDKIYVAADYGIAVTSFDFLTGKSLNKTYNTSQFYSVAFSHNNEELIGGTQGFGPIYIDGKGNSPETAKFLLPATIGGYTEISQIDPKVLIYSGSGSNLWRSNDRGETTSTDFFWSNPTARDSSLLCPFLLWENFNYPYGRDTISYRATKNYSANDNILIPSKNGAYPFTYTASEAIDSSQVIKVRDIVAAKFFVGVPDTIYMTLTIHDFTEIPKWFKIAKISGLPNSMAYSKDANYLFVGTTRGKLYRISNIAQANFANQANFTNPDCIIANSLLVTPFAGRVITSISVDPRNSAHIIVTLGNYGNSDYIYESTNALDEFPSFVSAQGNLPRIPVHTSLIEMNSSNKVIIGTDYGIFTTENLGNSTEWSLENTGMGEVPVMMLRQQSLDRPWSPGIEVTKNLGAIYIATNGRGLFENRSFVGINDHPEIVSDNALKIYPNPANELVKVSINLPAVSSVMLNIFDLSGQLVKSVKLGKVNAGKAEYSVSTSDLDTGNYLIQIAAGNIRCSAKLVVVH